MTEKITYKEACKQMGVHEGCAVAKGMQWFDCIKCGESGGNYANGVKICKRCRNSQNICAVCGKTIND